MCSLQILQLRAKELLARVSVAAARLGKHGLAFVFPQPVRKRSKGLCDVVGNAFGVGSAVVTVKVFFNRELVFYKTTWLGGLGSRGGQANVLWTSMIRPSVLPSGFLTFRSAGPDLVGIIFADVQLAVTILGQ